MIRKATLDDLDAIESIYNAILDQEEAGKIATGWKRGVYPSRVTATAAIQDADDMYVMTADGARDTIIAAVRINQEQAPEYADAAWEYDVPAEQVMVLHTLVVHPQESGCGYGRRFLAFYEELALQSGCSFLRMDTNVLNMRARRLYSRFGFTERGVIACGLDGFEGVQLVCLEKKLDIR